MPPRLSYKDPFAICRKMNSTASGRLPPANFFWSKLVDEGGVGLGLGSRASLGRQRSRRACRGRRGYSATLVRRGPRGTAPITASNRAPNRWTLAQTFCLDDRRGIGPRWRPISAKDPLGEPAGDRAVGDQVGQLPRAGSAETGEGLRCRTQGRFNAAEEILPIHPIRLPPWGSRPAATRSKNRGGLLLRDQHAGIICRETIGRHEGALSSRSGSSGSPARSLLQPISRVEDQWQQVGIGENSGSPCASSFEGASAG